MKPSRQPWNRSAGVVTHGRDLLAPLHVRKTRGYEAYWTPKAPSPPPIDRDAIRAAIASGVLAVGSPGTLRALMARFANAGVDQVIGIFQFGGLSQELAMESIARFGAEVMPAFS
jgi:hypothetical protein